MSKLDLSLGDIIGQAKSSRPRSSHPLNRTGGGGGGGGKQRRDRPAPRRDNKPYARPSVAAPLPAAVPVTRIVGDTIRVANLDPKVDEQDLRYIFEKVGAIRSISVHYNAAGQSQGSAEISFAQQDAAQRAVQDLDQAEVDGRIMYVQLVGQVVQQYVPNIVPRRDALALAPSSFERRDGRDGHDRRGPRNDRGGDRNERRGGGGERRERGSGAQRQQGGRDQQRRGGRGGRAGANGGSRRNQGAPAKLEDLDAEMDDWHSSKSSSSAAAPEQQQTNDGQAQDQQAEQ